MASMKEITCACGCQRKKMVRTADIKRGWGKFFSKSCKARKQEARTGQYQRHLENEGREQHWHDDDVFEEGWDGHKGTF